MKILVVEDEKKLAKFIGRALREDGHVVELCHDGEEGGILATREDYDAMVLDLQLPRRDGISILRELRGRKRGTPVVVLTARVGLKDRIRGLDEGADDYLTKPFSLDELRARIRAVLRRGQGTPATTLRFADLELNLANREAARGPRAVPLTARQFSLLETFLRNPDRVLTRSAIAERVWDCAFEGQSNNVDVLVKVVRRALEEGGEPRLIQTVRGVGYALREGPGEDG